MPETTSTATAQVSLAPDEAELVKTALRLLLSMLGRDEADEMAQVKALLRKLETAA
jgi:hypothetical protein